MIHFRALGVLDLRNSEGELRAILSQPKRLALLAWLALERPRGFQSRDTARALFWPECDDAHARRALNRAIYWLRKGLGEGVLLSRGDEEIGVVVDQCWTDVAAFEAAASGGHPTEALELYRGDLLRGFFVSNAAGFEKWLEAERERLRNLARTVGQSLTESEAGKGNLALATRWARWTLEHFPLDETSVYRLMSILDAAGDRAGAAQAYDQFAHHIAAEFEMQPSPQTQALAAAIRARNELPAYAVRAPSEVQRQDMDVPGLNPAVGATANRDDAVPTASSWPVEESRADAVVHAPARSPWRARSALAAVVAIVGILVAALALRNDGRAATDPRRVAVLAFENRTGESSFDYLPDMTRDWIVHGLAQTGMIEPVVFQPITSRMRGVPVLSRREDADQAAGRAGSTVRGAIYLAGATLRFEGTVTTSRGGLAWTLRSVTAPLDSPEQALREVSDRLTGAIAVLANPRFASWLPLGTTTPPTFDAFEEFARGDELQLSGRARDALAHFTRAASLDTTFTWSLVQAAFANLNMLDNAAADSIATSLKRERERLTPLELAWLDWIVAVIQEDEEEANRAITVAADMAPDRFLSMRAETLRWLNRPAEIVKILRPFGPGSAYHRTGAPYWNRIAESHHHLGQHRRELAVARRMRNHPPSRFEGLRAEIRALAALGRTSEVLSRLDDVESLPRGSIHSAGSILLHAAEELRAHGHLDPAAAILARSIDWYQGLPADEARRLNNRFELARALYLAGRLDEAESAFRQLAVDDPVYLTEYQGSIGAIAARRGDRETAESFVSMLERQRLAFDQPPKYAIFAQARIVALLGDSKRAVRMLREALGGQGRDLHMDADFEMLISDLDFKAFIRPKG